MRTPVPSPAHVLRGWEFLAERQTSLLLMILGDATDCTPPRPTQCAAELTPHLREAPMMRALRAGALEKVAAMMGPAFPGGSICRVPTFIPMHPDFSRARLFLDQLLAR